MKKSTIPLIGLFVSISYIIYVEFIREFRTEISFSMTNNINVLDVNEPIQNLSVKYLDLDLMESDEELKLIET